MLSKNLEAGFPGFWRNEQSGVLRPVVELYLAGLTMTDEHVGIMRAYLIQWIEAPVWKLDEACSLVRDARAIRTKDDIGRWLRAGLDVGMDPL
jgi:hypothetical protein